MNEYVFMVRETIRFYPLKTRDVRLEVETEKSFGAVYDDMVKQYGSVCCVWPKLEGKKS